MKKNWYIEYDNQTFAIMHKPKYEKYIFKAADRFLGGEISIPPEIHNVPFRWCSCCRREASLAVDREDDFLSAAKCAKSGEHVLKIFLHRQLKL